jgi:hypothetical protein
MAQSIDDVKRAARLLAADELGHGGLAVLGMDAGDVATLGDGTGRQARKVVPVAAEISGAAVRAGSPDDGRGRIDQRTEIALAGQQRLARCFRRRAASTWLLTRIISSVAAKGLTR